MANDKNGGGDQSEKRPTPSRSVMIQRRQEAEVKAKSKTTTVTLRIPTELNSWLDEYRHLSYPTRIEKQGLVVEALRLLYMARGQPGSEVYDLEALLTSKSSTAGGRSKRK